MGLRYLSSALEIAVNAATSQTGRLQAIIDAFGGQPITARCEGTSGAHRRTLTLPLPTITLSSPRKIVLGAHLADLPVSTGDIVRWELRNSSGTPILSIDAQAGSGPASVDHAGPVKVRCTPTLAGVEIVASADLPANALPTWLPAAGEATTLTVSNGRLSNNFRDAATPWFGAFYHIKTCNDFSTSVVNPHFGANGMVVFFGGGHSGTNDNTVTGLQIGDVCTFRNLVPGTPYEGTGTDPVTRDGNGTGNQNDQLDFDTAVNTVDNKPGSPHSYGALDVIGPANGGASEGSLSLVIIPAVNRTNDGGSASSWKIDFPDTTSALYAWQRRGADFIALMNPITGGSSGGPSWAAPVWTQFVPAQNRTYIECNGAHSPRWFDHGTNQYALTSTATPRPRAPDNPNSGTMFLVPERNLLIFAERSSGVVRLLWKDVSVGQEAGGWNATAATLSASIPVPSSWSAACWCADNGRILVGMQTAANPAENAQFTTTAVIEIEIPATLSNTWQVTEAPLSSGSIQWFNTPNIWKKWSYNPTAKGITWLQFATLESGDLVQHYRPRGT